MLTPRRLQHLLALVNHAHFGRAAHALNISQPALSKSIQALEAELGVTLLERNHGEVLPTLFGKLVLRHSQAALSAESDLRREIDLLTGLEIGSLKVALGPYPSILSGYASVVRLLAKHPNLHISTHVTSWLDAAELVLLRKADLGIADLHSLQGDEQLITESLGQHSAHFFCSPDHPILSCPRITLNELARFPWVATRLPARVAVHFPADHCAAGSIDPQSGDFIPAIEINVPMQLTGFLNGSKALVLAPLMAMEQALRSGQAKRLAIQNFNLHSGYGFIYLRDRSLSPAALAYMHEIRTLEAELLEKEALLNAEFSDPK